MRPYDNLEFRRELARFVRPSDLAQVEKLYDRLLDAKSDLERGQRLVEIREILARTGAFGRFLNALPLFALRSAYRYISGFENCQREFPPIILREAMAMDMPLYGGKNTPFGRFTDAIKASPPPKDPTPHEAREWWRTIIASTPWRSARTTDPEQILRELYRAISNRSGRVQFTPKQREAWARKLIGMVMTHFEMGRSTFDPVPVPESFDLGYWELMRAYEERRNSIEQESKKRTR